MISTHRGIISTHRGIISTHRETIPTRREIVSTRREIVSTRREIISPRRFRPKSCEKWQKRHGSGVSPRFYVKAEAARFYRPRERGEKDCAFSRPPGSERICSRGATNENSPQFQLRVVMPKIGQAPVGRPTDGGRFGRPSGTCGTNDMLPLTRFDW